MNFLLLNIYLPIKQFIAGFIFDFIQKEYKANGNTYSVPKDLTTRFFRGAFTLGWYEKQERLFIPQYLPQDAKVLELGGCIGVVSCVINKTLGNPANHITVEANPFLIEHLTKNRDQNNCQFQIVNKILSSEDKVTFNINKSIVESSANVQTSQKVEIEGVTPEQLQEQFNVTFDTLIMDIEGGELPLLSNFKEFIGGLKRVYFEIHPFNNILTQEQADECEQILIDLGFTKKLDEDYFQIWEK
ncbi:FkbM family methyltransferase [Flammeovirga yaeyamensis]|uniref:FkbM family methyltransferase n=1 Tax=Flammeovirga yaeyamensis TaxID=367791 RepID=A0AAX1N6Q6_9BACT|nr:FkbM family methyltransferase [Flammeovirga yaeyamensis]MBB3700693.1 FkbM family methyltransferase [Flammeovirga yaeyamensis]NMF37805.1 FkbM family methyltransferase [Flammeovirga yaeyamensis]QWG02111.1 FkbM family methyltransferase [Flammeovirga yaeyamensis]